MQCLQCGAKWVKGNKTQLYLKCPICECDFENNPELKKHDSILELLLELIQEKGIEFCNNQQSINAYLNDYFPEKANERAKIQAVLNQGVGNFVYEYKMGNRNESVNDYCASLNSVTDVDGIISALEYICEVKEVKGSDIESEEFYLELFDIIQNNKYKALCLKKASKINNNDTIKIRQAEFEISTGNVNSGSSILQELSDKNNPEAMIKLAQLYKSGELIAQNIEEEERLLKKAAQIGNKKAVFLLGCNYLFGNNDVINMESAQRCFEQIAGEDYPEAYFYLYKICYNDSKARKIALEHLKRAADLGVVSAKYEYAIHLLYGDDIEEDVQLSIQLLEKCAENGSVEALQKLKFMYMTGFKVSKDKEKARNYKEKIGEY